MCNTKMVLYCMLLFFCFLRYNIVAIKKIDKYLKGCYNFMGLIKLMNQWVRGWLRGVAFSTKRQNV